jgi:hypothetical protein
MNYRQLRTRLNLLTQEQLDADVTICDAILGEYFKVDGLHYEDVKFSDVLDHGHPFLSFNSTSPS